jgi:hypothetical protein
MISKNFAEITSPLPEFSIAESAMSLQDWSLLNEMPFPSQNALSSSMPRPSDFATRLSFASGDLFHLFLFHGDSSAGPLLLISSFCPFFAPSLKVRSGHFDLNLGAGLKAEYVLDAYTLMRVGKSLRQMFSRKPAGSPEV